MKRFKTMEKARAFCQSKKYRIGCVASLAVGIGGGVAVGIHYHWAAGIALGLAGIVGAGYAAACDMTQGWRM